MHMISEFRGSLLAFLISLTALCLSAQADSLTRYLEGGILTGSALPQVKLYNSYRQGGLTLSYGRYRHKWALELRQSFIVLGSGDKFIDHYSRWLSELQLRRIKISKWNLECGVGLAYSRYHISFLPFSDSNGNILLDPDERKVKFGPLSSCFTIGKPINDRLSVRITFNAERFSIFHYSYSRYCAAWMELRYAFVKVRSPS